MLEPDVKSEAQRLYPQACEQFEDRKGTPLGDLYIDVYVLTLAHLLNNATQQRIVSLMKAVWGVVDECLDLLPDKVQFQNLDRVQTAKVACCVGCSYCCNIRVTTTPVEAIAIAALDSSVSLEALKLYCQQTDHLEAKERLVTVLPCPYLSERRCAIYSDRPSTCRTWHSFDLDRCRADFEEPTKMVGVPMDEARRAIGLVAHEAMEEACLSLGLEFRMIEFIPAMKLLASDPSLVDRWLKGEKVFDPAYRPDLIQASEQASEQYD